MQLFLAIEIPDNIKKQIAKELIQIKNEYRDFQWVPEENYHITVHFFGETDRLEQIKERLSEILFDAKSFFIYSLSIDMFIKSKITIYLDFHREKTLENIEKNIREVYEGGNVNEIKFIPHLTVARCRIPSKQQYFVLRKRLEKIKTEIEFKVKSLTLFESIPNEGRPHYKKLGIFPLNG